MKQMEGLSGRFRVIIQSRHGVTLRDAHRHGHDIFI